MPDKVQTKLADFCLHDPQPIKQEPHEEKPTDEAATEQEAQPVAALPSTHWTDKKKYNKFDYRLKQSPEAAKNKWKNMRKDDPNMSSFIDAVLESKKGFYPEEFLRSITEHSKTEMDGEEGSWVSWKEISDKQGEEIVLEMIKVGTVATRFHSKLPSTTKIPYPQNQEFKHVVEVFSNKRLKTETDSHSATREATAESKSKFSESWAPHANNNRQAPALAASAPAPSRKDEPSDAEKAAVASLRKTHSAWDKAKRDLMALIARSENHPNTKSCKFEADLKAALISGQALDAKIVHLETTYMQTNKMSDQDIEKGAETAHELVDLIKASAKRAAAIRTCFKV